MASVLEIYITDRGSAPMQRVQEAEAVAGAGLRGDRYALKTGYWTGVDECQVTLISSEGIQEIARDAGISVANGEHRRNIITKGVDLFELAGKKFRVGEALLEFDRPRPPCRYIQSLTEPGMTKALGRGRSGICARVIESGRIRPGDVIEVVD